jgi:CP family cyanate transporter-like MFS transporter
MIVIALIFVALNLRPALSSLAPVLPEVMQSLAMSTTTASILTMAPVLCLGLFGFITPRLESRFGPERTVIGALLLLAAGIGLRGVHDFASLFIGTLLAGAGIGIAGVLLPGLVKRDFPHKASFMTGVYTMALCAGAAIATALTVPMSHWFGGWPAALAFWALPALAAALFWLPQTRQKHQTHRPPAYRVAGLWRDPLAWQVTLFMGLQSSLAYAVFGWLAPILRERGLDPVVAGYVVSVSIMVQVVSALIAPSIAARRSAQSGAVVLILLVTMTGLLGCLYAPLASVWLWAVVLGLGQGGSFAIALALLVLRAPDARVATYLSGMAQSVGYTIASMGPLLAGLLRDWAGSWAATGPLFVMICLLAGAAGFGAGRARYVRATVRTTDGLPK